MCMRGPSSSIVWLINSTYKGNIRVSRIHILSLTAFVNRWHRTPLVVYRSATVSKKQTNLAEKTCTLRTRTTASSGMRHIATSCTSYTHIVFSNTWVQMQSGNKTNNPLKSCPVKARLAGLATPPLLWSVNYVELTFMNQLRTLHAVVNQDALFIVKG